MPAAPIGTLMPWMRAGGAANLDAEEDTHVSEVFNHALDDGHYPEHDWHRHCELRRMDQKSLVSLGSPLSKVFRREDAIPVGRGPGTGALSWTEARSCPKSHAAFPHPFEINRAPCSSCVRVGW